ncbi:hypothetical protein B296_00046866 [Ensete ventricosum]|uniref:Uncharacterized protein n=1 Tax=Ensete ventricosum TaxID=4639 RepID=A0A426Z253_ENSVE|nr:hypothetical protein B296_00046866 [Ensete ventricosum]
MACCAVEKRANPIGCSALKLICDASKPGNHLSRFWSSLSLTSPGRPVMKTVRIFEMGGGTINMPAIPTGSKGRRTRATGEEGVPRQWAGGWGYRRGWEAQRLERVEAPTVGGRGACRRQPLLGCGKTLTLDLLGFKPVERGEEANRGKVERGRTPREKQRWRPPKSSGS